MVGGPGLRFVLEAAFLIAVAIAAGLAELSPTTIVLVMGSAWLLVAAIEWLAWRESSTTVTRIVREEPAPPLPAQPLEAPAEPIEAPAEPGRRRRFWRRRRPAEEEPEQPVEPVPEAPPVAAAPAPAGEDTQDLGPSEQPAAMRTDERSGP